ncbi:MAG: glutaredoxin-related protein [Pseudobutyrivibrio sp.]|nr:glutaredoxin-related protein [Pseudobutyrivibrio sp.]
MIKIYGLHTCPYCDFLQPQIEGKENEYKYIDIGQHVQNMHEFMDLRDNRPEFDHSKEIGDIGIPCFLFEDGRISLDPADAGLVEYDGASACSIEDHLAGKKGC